MLWSLCRKRWRCSSHRRESPCRPLSRLRSNLESRITSCTPHKSLISETLLILYRELERIRTSTAKWTKAEKNLPRRLLDARRVAEELEGVMKEIQQANVLFIVRSFYKCDGTAPLISALDGNHYEDGDEGREHPEGCWIHEAEYGGCPGELSSMTHTRLIADDDDRINVRITGFQFKLLAYVFRLALLALLRPVTEAFFNASNAPTPCLEGTREQLISDIFDWFNNTDPSQRSCWDWKVIRRTDHCQPCSRPRSTCCNVLLLSQHGGHSCSLSHHTNHRLPTRTLFTLLSTNHL
jgi:hypothetical protein